MVAYISVTSLFSFTLSSLQSYRDFYVTGVLCSEKKVAWFKTGVRGAAGELLPRGSPLEQLANAATGEKEGCFLIPACTGLTCL